MMRARVVVGVLAIAGAARAGCPDEASETLCEPYGSLLVPSLTANVASPKGAGAFYGGGLEVALFTWKSPLPTPGPSDGKVRLGAAFLGSSEASDRHLIPVRIGGAGSFESTASRSFLIPFIAADLGTISASKIGTRGFADAGLGLYVLHTHTVSIDAEGDYLLPFRDLDALRGPFVQLTASLAPW